MFRSFVRPGLVLALEALITYAGFANLAGLAHGATLEDRPIPAQLVSGPEPDDLNGACSKCRVNSLEAAQDATQDGATLELYYDDERGDLVGYIELTVLLYDGRYLVETIEAVSLACGEISVLELDGAQEWSWWHDVRHAWVEVVRTGG